MFLKLSCFLLFSWPSLSAIFVIWFNVFVPTFISLHPDSCNLHVLIMIDQSSSKLISDLGFLINFYQFIWLWFCFLASHWASCHPWSQDSGLFTNNRFTLCNFSTLKKSQHNRKWLQYMKTKQNPELGEHIQKDGQSD